MSITTTATKAAPPPTTATTGSPPRDHLADMRKEVRTTFTTATKAEDAEAAQQHLRLEEQRRAMLATQHVLSEERAQLRKANEKKHKGENKVKAKTRQEGTQTRRNERKQENNEEKRKKWIKQKETTEKERPHNICIGNVL